MGLKKGVVDNYLPLCKEAKLKIPFRLWGIIKWKVGVNACKKLNCQINWYVSSGV